MLRRFINKLLDGRNLTAQEMEEAFTVLTGGKVSHVQIGAFLVMLEKQGITFDELAGAARMMRRAAAFIDCGQRDVVDVVGTGGDRSNSFNISTTSAFVAAGAGVPMAKHGNRAATSKCGAADVLAELGVNLDAPAEVVENAITEHGIGFLYAPKMHPVMAKMKVVRHELGIPTIFNLLGPLTNPAGARSQVIGVYSPRLTELFAAALRELGSRRAMVVHGMDGLDEISSCAPTRVSELKDGEIRTYELLPEMFISQSYNRGELIGGDAAVNADILRSILNGREQGAKRAVVLLNAGAVIYVAGLAADLREGVRMAASSIDSGAAEKKLNELIEVTNG